ncbi:hypothetical protein H2199_009074 [Coniosporium tulheliwenetii]|uniref:Uncharacterized protein n=1 Tax=Coniosporium tulheliwenetii TaxID=3383036 RepID=A0ACC2YFM2_9PEZI|nr:hypothetical protein H2199_009074 [Cladosporium sp. JES 115]
MTGFKGYFNRLAGYGHSSNALKGVAEYLASQGVRFLLGEQKGKVTELLYRGNGKTRRCVGVRTADGKAHQAAKVICALGAYGASLIPDLGKFAVARCFVNVRDLGFFFEPDPATRLFKLCPLRAGYSNSGKDGTSLPPLDRLPPPQDFIPKEDEEKLRRLLRETLPWTADRPFVDKKMCWFSDSKDSSDSGHGFKMMPVLGKWVVDLLHKGRQERDLWKWRSEDVASPQRDWGSSVSWRIGEAKELSDVIREHQAQFRARLSR